MDKNQHENNMARWKCLILNTNTCAFWHHEYTAVYRACKCDKMCASVVNGETHTDTHTCTEHLLTHGFKTVSKIRCRSHWRQPK